MNGATFESAKRALETLTSWWSDHGQQNRNEATTRLHLIDRLLQDVLRWSPTEITAEESYGGTYADYSLGKPATLLIVEAKREGTYFELPVGVGPGVVPVATVADAATSVTDALRQVLGYCQSRGVPYAAICNGHQLVALLASRQDGVPPLEGAALVFDSLTAMRDDFRVLWDNLSALGVQAHTLASTLGDSHVATPPEKLSARIPNYPGYRRRNRIQAELNTLGDLVLEDIIKAPELEPEFLARCYSTSSSLSEYALVSKEILEARYSALDAAEGEVTHTAARRRGDVSTDLQRDLTAGGVGRRPLILLGDVGVGKSIFIRHFMRIDARDLMERSIVLYLNFGTEPALASSLSEYVMESFVLQLRDDYDIDIEADSFVRSVYKHDLHSFSKGVHGPLAKSAPEKYQEREIALLERKVSARDRHLQASLRYVTRSRKRQVVIFLDNIDQRGLEFQEEVFLIGQGLADSWPATVFLSLRPETFFRSRRHGSLTAYQPTVFTIAPPEIGRVVDKRLAYCREIVEDDGTRGRVLPDALHSQAVLLGRYLRILQASFHQNHELVEFVENLGGGNARAALGFVNTFVGSGHVDTQKILTIEDESGSYTVPLHEFVRAIMYGDYRYYDPASSDIANVFEISRPDPREHFLLPLLLAYIERVGEVGQEEGFVSASKILEFGQAQGFLPQQVEFGIRHATDRRLLQASPRISDEVGRRFRITTVGAYTVKKLMGTFVYLDAVIVDTAIVDDEVAGQIDDCSEIQDRVARSRIFRQYLDECWSMVGGADTGFDWTAVSRALDTDYERIERTLAKRHNGGSQGSEPEATTPRRWPFSA